MPSTKKSSRPKKQISLFPEPATVISVAKARQEPLLWVRRIVIWADLNRVIQDVTLRRGLNIVWSRDPGSKASSPGDDAEIGHGAGKTLFCRLLRYCLGENTFATTETTRQIHERFPEGYVGIEALVQGRLWSVLRPIGLRRREVVKSDIGLDELIRLGELGTGIDPFIGAIASTVRPLVDGEIIPGSAKPLQWLYILAWLARDQESRFSDLLSWRETRAQSESPALGLSVAEQLYVTRALLGMMTPDEAKEQARHATLETRKAEVDKQIEKLSNSIDRWRARILRDLRWTSGDMVTGSMEVTALRQQAEALAAQAESPPPPTESDALRTLRIEHEAIIRQQEQMRHKCEELSKTRVVHAAALKLAKGELPDEEVRKMRADLGVQNCPTCDVPIDVELLLKGCPYAKLPCDPNEAAQRISSIQEDIEASKERLRRDDRQLAEYKAVLDDCQNRLAKCTDQIRIDSEKTAEIQRDWQRSQQEKQAVLRDIDRYDMELSELEKLKSEEDDIEKNIEESRKTQTQLRDKLQKAVARFSELYQYSVRALIGSRASAHIQLQATKISAQVLLDGDRRTAAIDSLEAVAFDLAAMTFAMEGGAHIPAVFVHDSPREADIGLSIYHKLFKLVKSLEAAGSGEPAFQYIVTTTTEPPAELRKTPELVLELHGTPAENRLLMCDL